jgi:hypothetical protein
MIFTIKGEKFTKFDINKRCAVLLGIKVSDTQWLEYCDRDENVVITSKTSESDSSVNYCNVISDTEVIIDKCWDDLMSSWCKHGHYDTGEVAWHTIMRDYKCCKLTAACIFFIMENN